MSRLFPSLVLFLWYFLAAVFATEIVHESDTLKASNLHNSDRFSTFLALDGNTALIASPCNSVGGTVYEFNFNNGNWTQSSVITDPVIVYNDRLGTGLSLEGNTAVFGAPYHGGGGSAFVFRRDSIGSPWNRIAELKSAKTGRTDEFGTITSISGNRILVGAPYHNDGVKMMAGSFSIFEEIGSVWKEVYTTVPDLAKALSSCAMAAAIEGDYAFIGCSTDSEEKSSLNYAGSVLVYQRRANDGTWSRVDRLTASDAEAGDFFGWTIAAEGNTLVVSADGVDSAKADYSGAVYVFNLDTATNQWKQTAKLFPADSDIYVSAVYFYYFGISVSISGNDLVIGAYGDTMAHVGDYSGAAYLYQRDTATNTWNMIRKMTRSTPKQYDRVGMAVSTSQGNTLLSCDGADYDGINEAGAALYFTN